MERLRCHGLFILDNTDELPWETRPYTEAARAAGYRWDDERLDLVRLDTPVIPFDFDDGIVVKPEDYHALKDRIG